METLVEVKGLSKKFSKDLKTSLWYGVKDMFGGLLGTTKSSKLRKKEFWALKDINFELKRGSCLGLIGHNGAGKSTLLKVLNGLINPDEGHVTIKGRVGALIELGAGFNPILTGRENIYNNGAILGFTKREIDSKIEEIIEFSEIREFIDMPVQNYSSGMKVRLGFSIAVQLEPDVLIIDEVLAVGDANFVVKSYNRINELIKNCAVIFVSHSLPQIAKLADEILYLEHGSQLMYSANINETISTYLSKQTNSEVYNVTAGEHVNEFSLTHNSNDILEGHITLPFMTRLSLDFFIRSNQIKGNYAGVVIKFFDPELRPCGVYESSLSKVSSLENRMQIVIDGINLTPSTYSVSLWFISFDELDSSIQHIELGIESAFKVKITGESFTNFAFSRFIGDLKYVD